jgi:spermidine dehydrogenase
MNGGTLEIDSPRPYSAVADGLLKTLGVDPPALSAACDHEEVYAAIGLGTGAFFDKETFGEDRLVSGLPPRRGASAEIWSAFAERTPLSATARDDLVRINTGLEDPFPGLTSAQKKDRLSRMSYREYLKSVLGADAAILAFYQTATQGEWGVGIEAVSALDCWGYGLPGFQGLSLDKGSAPRMGPTPAGYADGGSYVFHFPDGNATIARLLVRSLVPEAVPGTTCEDVVTAAVNYAALDRQGAAVRIRLASTAIRVRNVGAGSLASSQSQSVEVAYVRGGATYKASASACVLASWNMMIPYLCPELPDAQKVALHALVKTPLVYTSVALRNWTAFKALGVRAVSAPNGYHTSLRLNPPVDIGEISAERAPELPVLVHMVRTPCSPGIPEHDQNRVGRAELLATTFETFEREIRLQLGRTLGAGGFDPARDITAITVNRWPHGYAPEYNPLWDPELGPELQPHVLGRARFGRIAIANSDAGGAAYTDVAIDQGYRAVSEILGL